MVADQCYNPPKILKKHHGSLQMATSRQVRRGVFNRCFFYNNVNPNEVQFHWGDCLDYIFPLNEIKRRWG